MGKDVAASLDRVSARERNNHLQGREGSGTPMKMGPATRSVTNPNPTQRGGINRGTKGSGAGESESRQN